MPTGPMRLARMIALSSSLSRRAAENAIASGEVSVDGEVVTAMGIVVDPASASVLLNGRPVSIPRTATYLAFNKPRGFIVTKSDPEGRPTIWKILDEWKDRLNSVGRLDYDSEGLIILTDDGDFINLLTHPSHEIWKTYRVRVKGEPGDREILKLREGIMLSDGRTLPGRVKRVDRGQSNALIEISIREGRNRQVRRMFEEIGFPVLSLKRTAIGGVKLGSLDAGEWRFLGGCEVEGLRKASGGEKR